MFALVEPLGACHHASVKEHRAAVDWTEEISVSYLSECRFPKRRTLVSLSPEYSAEGRMLTEKFVSVLPSIVFRQNAKLLNI